ncbi:cytochrome c oxidase assembly protein [Luteimonas aestuarii]|uniref:cytochrome c oxidase assembly protein n=1 Tax=Luteimonas aestuarii TaxID=453837 RepID=UPI001404DC55|nr:cytochrome c oxidase assembly protein [Luteimonas aestuarii]
MPHPVWAAGELPGEVPTLATAWSLSPVVPALLLVIALYGIGLSRLWRGGHAGRGISIAEAASFFAGTGVLVLAMVWPVDAYGAWLLSAHMGQHMLLLALAPPLLLAGRPLAVLAAALPPRWSKALHRVLHPLQAPFSRTLALATSANVAVMWGWHAPAALALVMRSEPAHWLMHGSFLLAGLWLWTLLWQRIRDDASGALSGAIAIVVVMMQMGFLGALLVFSRRILHPVYADRAAELGITAFDDQQLAGLIMWVPSALPYLVGAVWLLAREFRRMERRPG